MGYRVGYQCFNSSEAAHDYILSQQLPTITSEGQLIRPVKQDQEWYLSGQKIQLSFPECSIPEQIQLGAQLAAPVIVIAVIVFGVKQAINLIKELSKPESERSYD